MMSWPDLACASAAIVSRSLLPCEGMKSIWTSTFSLAAHSLTRALVALLAPGTQWSQKPIDSLPAAPARAHERRRDHGRGRRSRGAPRSGGRVMLVPRHCQSSRCTGTGIAASGLARRPALARRRLRRSASAAHEALRARSRPRPASSPSPPLHVAHDHLGHDALRVDLHARSWAGPARPRSTGSGGCAGWDSGRAYPSAALLGPGLEVGQLLERRHVVAVAGLHHLLGRGAASTDARSRLLAADLFLPKPRCPRRRAGTARSGPSGPAGMPCVQHCSATCGASRLATAQALGGFMISAPLPETSHLLLEASSHAGASGG